MAENPPGTLTLADGLAKLERLQAPSPGTPSGAGETIERESRSMFRFFYAGPSRSVLADPATGFAAWRLWLQAAETGIHAALTIQARLAMIGTAMLTGRDYPLAESWQMVAEKQQALLDATHAAWRANPKLASDSRAVLRMATAGLRPYRQKTRSNARRLNR